MFENYVCQRLSIGLFTTRCNFSKIKMNTSAEYDYSNLKYPFNLFKNLNGHYLEVYQNVNSFSSYSRSQLGITLIRVRECFKDYKISECSDPKITIRWIQVICNVMNKKCDDKVAHENFCGLVNFIENITILTNFLHWSENLKDGLPSSLAYCLHFFGKNQEEKKSSTPNKGSNSTHSGHHL